jgi:RHS repeat-associated protein
LKAGHSNRIYFLTDALGSVRDVVDSTGAVKASYEFDPDGNKVSPPNTTGVESQKTWIGGYSVNDDVGDSGLYLMGHRHYDPSLGRFLSRDPIGFAGGLNLYEYSRSSPISKNRPAGSYATGRDYLHWRLL